MERRNNIIIFFLLLLVCSCEKQRLLNVPIVDTKYVVNGLYGSDEPCRLEITKSQSLNDTSSVRDIATADVFLYENGNLLEKLSYSPPSPGNMLGLYTGNYRNFAKSKNYAIDVKFPDGTVLSAADKMPDVSVDIQSFKGSEQGDSINKYLNFELVLRQKSIQKQFFHLFLQQRWVRYHLQQGDSNLAYTPWFDKAISPENNPVNFIPTSSEPFSLELGTTMHGIMLDNQRFNGSTKSIKFSANSFYPQLSNTYLESRVIIRSVSENYFEYYFSSSQYNRTRGVPLTEPVIVHNNVMGGLGNFSGYTADTSFIVRTVY